MSLKTLRDDIYKVLCDGTSVSKEQADGFGQVLSRIVHQRRGEPRSARRTLRLSNLGTKVPRKLWYDITSPDKGEPLSPATRLKFLFGDIIEALTLFLVRVSGHTVTDEQKEVTLHGITGHIDGLIDNELVDVKSSSTMSFGKFAEGLTEDNDTFGYLGQLRGYATALNKDNGSFIAVDKQHGHITIDTHTFTKEITPEYVHDIKRTLAGGIPPRGYEDEVQSPTSPNRKLCTACSYCGYKKACWGEGLRTFIYSGRSVHLTRVLYEPRVPEIT